MIKKVAKKEKNAKPKLKAKEIKEEDLKPDVRPTFRERKEMEMTLHTQGVTIARMIRQIEKWKAKVKELKKKKHQTGAPLIDQVQTLKTRIAKLEALRSEAATEARESNSRRKEAERLYKKEHAEAGEAHAGYLDITKRFEAETKLYSLCELHAKKKKPVESCKCPVCVLLARLVNLREEALEEIKKRKKTETALWKLQSKEERNKRQGRK